MKWFNTPLKNGTLAVLFLLCVACWDKRDWDFGKLNFENLNPTLHLPLLSDTLFVTDALEGDNIQFIDHLAYFVYDLGDIDMPDATALFTMPDQHLSFDALSIAVPAGVPGGGGIQIPPFERSGSEVDYLTFSAGAAPVSITFSGGTLRVANVAAFPGGGTLTLTVPSLVRSGQPFTAVINVGSTTPNTVSLQDYTLTVPDDGKLEVEYTYRTDGFTVDASIDEILLELRVDITNIAIGEAHGYLGHHTEYASAAIDIGDFNNMNGNWDLKEAAVRLEVDNALVLPMRAVIDTLRSYTNIYAAPAVERQRVDSINISAPAALGATAHTAATLSVPGDVLNVLPKKLETVIRIETNPNGTQALNAIRSTATLSAKATIIVPLKLKDISLTLIDTADFDTSDVTFNNMGLLLYVQNSLPIGVELQCRLLHKDTGIDLGTLFNAPVRIPAGNTSPVSDDESEVTSPSTFHRVIPVVTGMDDRLKQSGRIVVEFTAFSSEGRFVRITDRDNVQIKIGVSADMNVENLVE
ncbi:MAG: hypothetical protein LBS12_00090 [Prevotellaceae bacterium]|jgi:hypothetical protein|nr:hypothetical protein [Prevotellaceae bacterium]